MVKLRSRTWQDMLQTVTDVPRLNRKNYRDVQNHRIVEPKRIFRV